MSDAANPIAFVIDGSEPILKSVSTKLNETNFEVLAAGSETDNKGHLANLLAGINSLLCRKNGR